MDIINRFLPPKGKEKRYIALGASLLYPSMETYGIGVVAHVVCNYLLDGKGPSCFYSAISGVRIAEGGVRNYVLAAAIVGVNISDYDLPFNTQAAHVGMTAAGFALKKFIL